MKNKVLDIIKVQTTNDYKPVVMISRSRMKNILNRETDDRSSYIFFRPLLSYPYYPLISLSNSNREILTLDLPRNLY